MSIEILVIPAGDWAGAVADRWADRLAANPGMRVCLPAGETPRPLYRAMARRPDALSKAEVFLLDEFALPAGDPARCEAMLQRDLLDHIGPPAAVHRLDVSAEDVGAECARYDAVVSDGGLDLALVGLGANGHIGLNEPGTPPDAPTRVVSLADETGRRASVYGTAHRPTWGMTIGLRPLLSAREIWLLVTGPHKAAILKQTIEGPLGPDVPATFLRGHPNAVVLADPDAARLL